MGFDLSKFERFVYGRQHEDAGRELLELLNLLDRSYGQICVDGFEGIVQAGSVEALSEEHFIARITAAITCLGVDRDFNFSDSGFDQFLNLHRWISALFSASQFGNADHILRSFNINESKESGEAINIDIGNIKKYLVFYSLESQIPLDIDAVWSVDPKLAAGIGLALLSPRFVGTPNAHYKREQLLQWLPSKLPLLELKDLPGSIVHDVYMHCSYADAADRHFIKKSLNSLIKKQLNDCDLVDLDVKSKPSVANLSEKPILVVVLEWFSVQHSIYRTHSLTIEGMRNRFHIIGIGYKGRVDQVGVDVFDEFIHLAKGQNVLQDLKQIRNVCQERCAQVLYMPSVGMFPLTMLLSNLRVAPIQLMALGHPATTHSSVMDYAIVEEDYVGDPACFSEKLLVLPKDGMPYREPSGMKGLQLRRQRSHDASEVWVAVAATVMKLNPEFLESLRQIRDEAKSNVKFHFLVGQATGLIVPSVKRLIERYLGTSGIVYPHQSYESYMKTLCECDVFLNPFPFGNTNGIIDTVYAGLVGVCKTGAEVFEHIDQGLFGRLNMPSWLVAKSTEEYINSAIRLIDNFDERLSIAREFSGPKRVISSLFNGREAILGELIEKVWLDKRGGEVA